MTKLDAKYLNRLHARRMILEARLERTSLTDTADIRKELHSLWWAIEIVEKVLSGRQSVADADEVAAGISQIKKGVDTF